MDPLRKRRAPSQSRNLAEIACLVWVSIPQADFVIHTEYTQVHSATIQLKEIQPLRVESTMGRIDR
jgi:hypothetical protein